MARFRSKSTTKTINLAGGEAFKESPKLELVSLLLTSFVQDKFYESADAQLVRLKQIVQAIPDKKFIGKSAIYARHEIGMRSITHALLGELVLAVKGEPWTKTAIAKGVKRPDDMLEILGYVLKQTETIPNSLKKGLALAIKSFDAYQLAKYRGGKSDLKLVDLFNLVHPKPITSEEKKLYASLMKGELKSTETWEAKLSKAGQLANEEESVEELKKAAWNDLLKEKKLGYFALLRNLRNIAQQAPNCIDLACEQLLDKKALKSSLVLPFRFQTAMDELQTANIDRRLIVALSKALDLSVDNVPKFPGTTLVVLDESGSMSGKPGDIGSLFAAVLYKANNADLITFSNDARYRRLNPNDSALTIAKQLRDDFASGGTNFHAPLEIATKAYNRIVFLSDMQGWVDYNAPTSTLAAYKKRTGSNPFIYSFDLAGHGTLQFPEKQIFCIAGFSEKVLELMGTLEQDKNALIAKIEAIEL